MTDIEANEFDSRLLVLLLLAVPFFCSHSSKARAASLNTELQSLDPICWAVNATRVFAYLVFDMLVSIDNEGKHHPRMLESSRIDDARLICTFDLRGGLAWSGDS